MTLPNYIIIGVQKGGTSSLQEYLIQHPDISVPSAKEVHFFDDNYHKGLGWYKKHFPKPRGIIGEASPYYIYHPLVAKRIAKVLPNTKIIVLLREPIDRAFSDYRMEYNRGKEKLSFGDAIQREKENLKKWKDVVNRGEFCWEHKYYSYIERGKYFDQLSRWFKHFDRKQFLIIESQDFFSDVQKVVSQVFQFLGVKDYKLKDVGVYNKGRKNIELDKEAERHLSDLYNQHNKSLYKLLNKNFDW